MKDYCVTLSSPNFDFTAKNVKAEGAMQALLIVAEDYEAIDHRTLKGISITENSRNSYQKVEGLYQ
jgi:hypothetical protein